MCLIVKSGTQGPRRGEPWTVTSEGKAYDASPWSQANRHSHLLSWSIFLRLIEKIGAIKLQAHAKPLAGQPD